MMTPEELMREYERRTNTHRFEQVAPLIADDAVYWFSDGSFRGKAAIRRAFEATWTAIRDEHYAVCAYTFRWQGQTSNGPAEGTGRGTSVLRKQDGDWQVVHEHLSPMPD